MCTLCGFCLNHSFLNPPITGYDVISPQQSLYATPTNTYYTRSKLFSSTIATSSGSSLIVDQSSTVHTSPTTSKKTSEPPQPHTTSLEMLHIPSTLSHVVSNSVQEIESSFVQTILTTVVPSSTLHNGLSHAFSTTASASTQSQTLNVQTANSRATELLTPSMLSSFVSITQTPMNSSTKTTLPMIMVTLASNTHLINTYSASSSIKRSLSSQSILPTETPIHTQAPLPSPTISISEAASLTSTLQSSTPPITVTAHLSPEISTTSDVSLSSTPRGDLPQSVHISTTVQLTTKTQREAKPTVIPRPPDANTLLPQYVIIILSVLCVIALLLIVIVMVVCCVKAGSRRRAVHSSKRRSNYTAEEDLFIFNGEFVTIACILSHSIGSLS